ncbi:MAG TPA: O-antigen ligase family protein [Verrucomicrobiae bacterium]|nr:O-antigen ligase family protein [Verrucomicrobiae bacterium]
MQLTEAQAALFLRRLITFAICCAVAIVTGWWTTRTHYLIVLASVLALTFTFATLANIEWGIFGLLMFSQLAGITSLVFPLPLGVNEFNIIFAMLIGVVIARFAITHKWDLKLRDKNIGNFLYLYFLLIFVATMRAYLHPPLYADITSRTEILTSNFIKPVMYMGTFFIALAFSSDWSRRRRFAAAMGCWLMLYCSTMFLQLLGAFPILSEQVGKQEGGLLGSSNALGSAIALYFVFYLTRKPYFGRGWQAAFPITVVLVSLMAMVLAIARTSWVVAACGGMMLALTQTRWSSRAWSLIGFALLLTGAALFSPASVKEYFMETTAYQVGEAGNANALLSGRLNIWNTALQYLKDDPKRIAVGGGKLDFRSKGPDYGLPQEYSTHHQLIQTLVDEGILGILVEAVLFGRVLWVLGQAWRRSQSAEVKQLARLLAICTVQLVISGYDIDGRTASWYWFLLGMFVAAKTSAEAVAPTLASTPEQVAVQSAGFATTSLFPQR